MHTCTCNVGTSFLPDPFSVWKECFLVNLCSVMWLMCCLHVSQQFIQVLSQSVKQHGLCSSSRCFLPSGNHEPVNYNPGESSFKSWSLFFILIDALSYSSDQYWTVHELVRYLLYLAAFFILYSHFYAARANIQRQLHSGKKRRHQDRSKILLSIQWWCRCVRRLEVVKQPWLWEMI